MKILIIKLSSLGDIIHSLPVLTNLKAQFAQAEIHWLISENFAPLLSEHTQITELHKLPKSPLKWLSVIRKLRQENFDYILDLQGLIKTGLLSCLIGAKETIGLIPAREGFNEIFLTHKIQTSKVLDSKVHIVERSSQILKHFGEFRINLKAPRAFNLPILQSSFNLPKNFIVCAPETRWQSKNWPIKHWQELINKLKEISPIIILGSNEETFQSDSQIINLSGQTQLKDLMDIIPKANLVIGSDSGIIHLAAAYNVRTLGLYGPTAPTRTGPWQGNYLWLTLQCSPCHKRECPLNGENNLKCLKEMNVEMVLSKIQEIIK